MRAPKYGWLSIMAGVLAVWLLLVVIANVVYATQEPDHTGAMAVEGIFNGSFGALVACSIIYGIGVLVKASARRARWPRCPAAGSRSPSAG